MVVASKEFDSGDLIAVADSSHTDFRAWESTLNGRCLLYSLYVRSGAEVVYTDHGGA